MKEKNGYNFDLNKYMFKDNPLNDVWQMNIMERMAMLDILNRIKPNISIEIGTFLGGSLWEISKKSKKVYSFDLNHDKVKEKSCFLDNVEFITGNSKSLLPIIIKHLNKKNLYLEFVLVDGVHSELGVKADIESILEYKPRSLVYILMHDSFNPFVRKGIITTDWHRSPYVFSVEVDFVFGTFHHRQNLLKQMWGGFALAIMSNEKRKIDLVLSARNELNFKTILKESVHNNIIL